MRKILLFLCILLVLASCQSEAEIQEQLKQEAQRQAQQQVDQAVEAAKEEANQAKDSFFGGIGEAISSVLKSIQDWWNGIWGNQPSQPPVDPQEPKPDDPVIYIVKADGTRGRQCSKLTCKIVVTFKSGQEIQVFGTEEGDIFANSKVWLRVSYKDSIVFVHGSLASLKAPLADLPSDALLPFEGTMNYTGGPHVADDTTPCNEKELSTTDGIDFSSTGNNENFEVLSISEGIVLAAQEWDGNTFGRGTFVRIQHPNGLISEYWHLSRISDEIKELMKGQNHTVIQGFPLGFAGDSGGQSAVHLHLRISRSWHGQSINGYHMWMHLKPGSNSIGFNYQGSATKGQTKEHEITLSASACGEGKADATVGVNFTGTEEKNGIDPNTLFAEDRSNVPQAPMVSTNHRATS